MCSPPLGSLNDASDYRSTIGNIGQPSRTPSTPSQGIDAHMLVEDMFFDPDPAEDENLSEEEEEEPLGSLEAPPPLQVSEIKLAETEHELWLKSFDVFVADKPGKGALVDTLQSTGNFFMLLSTKFDDQDSSVVDKVLHCPEQMHRLCNYLSDGSSRNTAKHIDFQALRGINVAVHGLYGDVSRAVDALRCRGVVDEDKAAAISFLGVCGLST